MPGKDKSQLLMKNIFVTLGEVPPFSFSDIQKILVESLAEAKVKGRVTCGLYQTAEALER